MSDRLYAETTVFLSIESTVELMDIEDIASFCSAVAKRLDGEYANRNKAVSAFESGLSEQGARFLAEVITHHYMRTSK